jgi:hypothetical protein
MNMKSDDVEGLKAAVEGMHNCRATFIESVPILESWKGTAVWEGVVNVFDLTGHPEAKRAYAWSEPIAETAKRQFFTVLNLPPIDSPLKAVQATIVDRQRRK